MSFFIRTALLVALFLCVPFSLSAEVRVYDSLAVRGATVMLKAETRGRLFRKGGEVVMFHIDGESIGQALSGGDGIAYKEFLPRRAGLFPLKVVSGANQDTGYVLSVKRGGAVVFVDVSGSLMGDILSRRPRPGSTDAVKRIMGRFPLVYMATELLGISQVRAWLKENGFPEAPLLEYRGGRVFLDAVGMGIRIKAVIGGIGVVEKARESGADTFTFDAAGGHRRAKDWKEIEDAL